MNTIKDTQLANIILENNNLGKIHKFCINYNGIDHKINESEKAICYRLTGERLNGDCIGVQIWIPKSIIIHEILQSKNGNNFNSITIPAWFYNKFINERGFLRVY